MKSHASPSRSNRHSHFHPGYVPTTGTTTGSARGTTLLKGKTTSEQIKSIIDARKQPRRIQISFEVYEHQAPALKAAVDEISGSVATRLEGKYEFPIEQALTDAAGALGVVRAAITAAGVPFGDPSYRSRR